ncbi:MAG: hypothetical protein PHE47_08790 [Oscillospiraceae bacterium]|nr:hypothetical protein [Oscillospiraceae bacterium]
MSDLFGLRPFDFFANGNEYTGSAGALRYLIKPKDGALQIQTWDQDVCYELAQIHQNTSFPLTPEGLGELRVWLSEQCGCSGL